MRKNYSLLLLAIVFTVNAMAQNIPSYVPKDGLVGYWPFNGNANDESGNGNNGTVNGATLTTDRNGVANSAYSFDGVSKIIINNSKSINFTINQSYTIGLWIKTYDQQLGYTGIVSKMTVSGSPNASGYQFVIGNSTKTGVLATEIGQPSYYLGYSGSQNVDDGKWKYVMCVFNRADSSFKFYVNGQLDFKTFDSKISTINLDNNANMFFGVERLSSIFFKGQLDDIAIYNRALTEQEITALYTEKPVAQNIPSYVPTNGLVGYWPFNGNANDESGNNHNLIISGPKLSSDRKGNTNSSYYFNGIDNYLYTSSIGFPTKERTVSIWYNVNNANEQPTILGYGGSSICGTSWFQGINTEKSESFVIAGHCKVNEIVKGYSEDQITNWHHLVVTNDINGKNIFLDGKLIASDKIFINNTVNSNNTHFAIGVNVSAEGVAPYTDLNSFWTKGQLDDIAIYNRALTEQEITALYSGTTNLASTKVFVDAPASVNQNDTLELSISTETLNSSDNVIAYQTDITYDTTRYTFVSNHTVGTLNPKASVDLNTDKKGTIKVGYISTSALQGAGSLLKLKFKANQQVGQGIFGLSKFIYNNTDITSLKNDTVLTLDVTPPSASISLSQNPVRKGDSLLITVKFSETMTDKPAPQVSLSGANTLASSNLTKVNETTYTYWWVVEKGNGIVNLEITSAKDLAGNNLSKATSNTTFTVLPTLFGDIDTNKFIRAYDAALALQYSVGLNPLPSIDPLPWSNWRIAVANVDTVGSITANDAALIVKYSIGKITSFPADAKKRGEAPVANITVTQEANQLVFRATGTLYAFNVFMKDNFNAFGQPEVKDKNAMIATNITSTTYNVGLASTTAFTENEPFLVIPIVTNENLEGTMDIIANAQEKALAYGAAASIATNQNEAMVIYPNPTKDVVTINNAQGKTVKIVDVQGKEVYNAVLPNAKTEISLKALGAKGMYVVHILDANNLPVQTKHIVLE